MTELRWILLGAGLAMLAGIYLWGVRARRRSGAQEAGRSPRLDPPVTPAPPESLRIEPQVRLDDEREPVLETIPVVNLDEERRPSRGRAPARREPTFGEPVDAPAADEPDVEPAPEQKSQKIIAVRLMARPPGKIDGARLREALAVERMEFGRYEIFHRLDPAGRPIFSMASLLEPGTFEPETMAESAYPGIALFAVLPGPVSGQQAFEELIDTARTLADRLDCILLDDRGASLSIQRISHMREEMLEFDRARFVRPVR
jgi:cell division protein ZipA